MKRPDINRRTLLGGMAGAGLAGLAGCTGQDGGGGPETVVRTVIQEGERRTVIRTKVQERTVVREVAECQEYKGTLYTTIFPISEFFVVHKYMTRAGIFASEAQQQCYQAAYEFKLQDLPDFLSGRSYFEEGDPLEIGRIREEMGAEEMVIFAKHSSTFTGVFAKAGGPYDPEVTGSRQASVDKMVENDDRFGIFSWGTGNTPANQVIMGKIFGYEMVQEGGDLNVFSVSPAQIPQLLLNDELALATTSPAHGGGKYIYNDEIVPLWWDNLILPENDLGRPNFANYFTTRELLDNAPEGIGAFFRAHQKACTWFHEKGPEVVPQDSELNGAFANTENQEQVQWVMDFITAAERGIVDEVKHANPAPATYKNTFISKDFVQENIDFGNAGAELGLIPEDWADGMTFETFIPPQGTGEVGPLPGLAVDPPAEDNRV